MAEKQLVAGTLIGVALALPVFPAWMATSAHAANNPIVVNSATDERKADQITTLREAVAIARRRSGPDRIVFAAGLFLPKLEAVLPIDDPEPVMIDGDRDDDGQADVYILSNGSDAHLQIRRGSNLTVMGIDFLFGSGAGSPGTAGAPGAPGTEGKAGVSYSQTPQEDAGKSGGSGKPGGTGRNGTAGKQGETGAGSIRNSGTLHLIRVGFADNFAHGGTGGPGAAAGKGGNGGMGGRGARGQYSRSMFGEGWPDNEPQPAAGKGGSGAPGGDGGDGGAGGAGGDAAGAIFNADGAELTLTDVAFGGRLASGQIRSGNTARGGMGAKGGGGGAGGDGGGGGGGGEAGVNDLPDDPTTVPRGTFTTTDDTGETVDLCRDRTDPQNFDCGRTVFTQPGSGGHGSNGGDAGNYAVNGSGGDAVGAVLNRGALAGAAAIVDSNAGTGGSSDTPWPGSAAGGAKGGGGFGGFYRVEREYFYVEKIDITISIFFEGNTPPLPPDGSNGLAGDGGKRGTVGRPGQGVAAILNKAPGTNRAKHGEGLVYVHDLGVGVDDKGNPILSFNVLRIGDVAGAAFVKWRMAAGKVGTPVSGSDFVGGVLPSGSVKLDQPANPDFDRQENARRVDTRLRASAFAGPAKTYRVILESVSGPAPRPILGTASVAGTIE